MDRRLILIVLAVVLCTTARAQFSAVRTNALMWATGTINAGIDVRVHNNVSLDFYAFYNPIQTPDLRMQTLGFQPSVRYWLYETQVGPFFSVHGTVASYNVGNRQFHYKGFLAGAGVSYGYNWILSKRWSVGVEIGIGAVYMSDTKRDYYTHYTDDEYVYHNRRWTVAPTKAEVSFIYLF